MKKFLIILYILIFVALAYYVTNLFMDRNQESSKSNNVNSNPKIIESTKSEIPVSPKTLPPTETDEITNTITPQIDATYQITRDDCANNCDVTGDTERIDYCKQICGLTPITPQADSCDDLSNLEKDYCLRNEAITENDLTKCQQITDSGVSKQCINRLNEDFIDGVMK